GKTIVPFASSGGSGLGVTEKTLQQTVPHATVKSGRMLNGHPAEAALKNWAAGFGL
ncbi:MAG: flavodoxin, partial [Firmicutes bacterium]|nr:flavodoxin [Bacillota bacterium]